MTILYFSYIGLRVFGFTKNKTKSSLKSISHYAFVVDNLVYVMVCARLNITHVIGMVSWFLTKPG